MIQCFLAGPVLLKSGTPLPAMFDKQTTIPMDESCITSQKLMGVPDVIHGLDAGARNPDLGSEILWAFNRHHLYAAIQYFDC